jgi:hypothetical protein
LLLGQAGTQKDRVVPIGERAIGWVKAYLERVRADLVFPPDHGELFLTHEGTAIARGHAQIDTQVSIRKLKAVHRRTHPGATVDRGDGAFPSLAAPSDAAAEALRDALAEERHEDDGEDGGPARGGLR